MEHPSSFTPDDPRQTFDSAPGSRWTSRAWGELLVVLAICIAVYWPWLGWSSLSMSEGMRVFPGWEMLQRGEWLLPSLFEQPYLRKPPGVPLAIAASAGLFGESEWSARVPSAVSATLSALVTCWFARRWWGRGMLAGALHALTPGLWYAGRAAEIEATHNLGVQLAMLALVDLLMRDAASWRARLGMAVALAMGMTWAVFTKGPAGVPAFAGMLLACGWMRGWRSLKSPWMWGGMAVSAAILGSLAWLIAQRLDRETVSVVMQSPSGFLWDKRKIGAIVALPLVSLLSMAPVSLAFGALFLGHTSDEETRRRRTLAKAIGWGTVIGLLIYSVLGVSNNRYAMPATMAVPLAVAAAARELSWFGRERVKRGVGILVAGLCLVSCVNIWWSETRRERISGVVAGRAIGEALPDGAVVWANQVIEYRPEVLWYARERAREMGKNIRVLWMPAVRDAGPPPTGTFMVLRDPLDPAVKSSTFEIDQSTWGPVLVREVVHKYEVELRVSGSK